MKTRKTDYNQLFAICKAFCEHGGLSAGATAYLPVKYPVWYKIRIAELFAEYKMFPAQLSRHKHFPELGLCIIFIPFTYGLLGRYDATTTSGQKAFLQYWIHHKALMRQEMMHKYPTE